nr:hypothetical protein CFP56_22038 [Quercus suber]
MLFSRQAFWAGVPFLVTATYALPRPNPQVTYSVVDVDGGDSTTPSATTIYQTVTDSATSTPTSHLIISSVAAESTSASKVTDTVTLPGATHTVSIGKTSLITVYPTSTSSLSSVPSSSTTAPTVAPETVTVISISREAPTSTSTTYFDNGMWHTYYPMKTNWNSQAASPTPSSSTVETAAEIQQSASKGAANDDIGPAFESLPHPALAGSLRLRSRPHSTIFARYQPARHRPERLSRHQEFLVRMRPCLNDRRHAGGQNGVAAAGRGPGAAAGGCLDRGSSAGHPHAPMS